MFPNLLHHTMPHGSFAATMQMQLAIQKLLNRKFAELKEKNPSYSLRAFSRRLRLSPGTVSLVLNGKRAVSRKLAAKVCNALLLAPEERAELFSNTGRALDAHPTDCDSADLTYLQLTADRFRMLSDWHYYAILSLLKTSGFKNDPSWISKRLGVPVQDAAQAIERMKRLEILTEKDDGSLERTDVRYSTSDDVADASVRKSHFQSLDLAKAALEQLPVELRDFTAITMPTHPAKLAAAKAAIRRFQDEMSEILENGPGAPSEVYRLCIQLFPLTKPSKGRSLK